MLIRILENWVALILILIWFGKAETFLVVQVWLQRTNMKWTSLRRLSCLISQWQSAAFVAGMARLRTALFRLNSLRAAVGRYHSCLHKRVNAPFHGLWVWRRRRNGRPCCPPMSNLSISPWTAWPDGSGWCDNRPVATGTPKFCCAQKNLS